MKITLANVRGFEGVHKFSLRPITILIGENSSGKTTLLGCIAAALNQDFPTTENLFNRAPFELGGFNTIATYRGSNYGRAPSFSLGWEADENSAPMSILAKFKNQDGAPRLDGILAKYGHNELLVQAEAGAFEFSFSFHGNRHTRDKKTTPNAPKVVRFKKQIADIRTFRFQDTFRYYMDSLDKKVRSAAKLEIGDSEIIEALHELTFGTVRSRPHVTALAPMRTRPRRTYDDLNDEFRPEGDHIPLVLARLLAKKAPQGSKELDALTRFGRASGLFQKIDVKRLGKQSSEPFQVRIKTKGPDANLIDVGYGVSQALPIVIDSIMAPKNEVLLVQQPEVHLHPKAQAALGTFFVELAVSSSKQFIIETHSDYLVDRVRMAVAEKLIPARNVQLLYLSRKGLDIRVHELSLDEVGNITNAPAAYRDFFLDEELRLMGRAL